MLILKKRDFAATFCDTSLVQSAPQTDEDTMAMLISGRSALQTHPQRTLSAGISAPNKPTSNAEPVLPSHR